MNDDNIDDCIEQIRTDMSSKTGSEPEVIDTAKTTATHINNIIQHFIDTSPINSRKLLEDKYDLIYTYGNEFLAEFIPLFEKSIAERLDTIYNNVGNRDKLTRWQKFIHPTRKIHNTVVNTIQTATNALALAYTAKGMYNMIKHRGGSRKKQKHRRYHRRHHQLTYRNN